MCPIKKIYIEEATTNVIKIVTEIKYIYPLPPSNLKFKSKFSPTQPKINSI